MSASMPSRPPPSDRIPVRVRSVRDEARDIRSLEFEAVRGGDLPPWPPGAHVLVYPPACPPRAYALCSLPGEAATYRIAVRRDAGTGNTPAQLHALHPGDQLAVSAPHSSFALDEGAERHLLVAGGIGIAPLLSMFRALERGGAEAELHYFARSEDDAAFLAELEGARARGTLHCHFGLSGGATAARLQDLFATAAQRPGAGAGLAIYTCGPAGLMRAVDVAAAANLHAAQLRQQHFGPTLDQ
ncbi:ferredoxin reductase [Azoarcus olearius]|uniref:Hypothetical flavodoxin reductase n=1 Tax=Azoarcus sp. (strain BH72) TaxID=418699 RepID=A1K212_AZOSB|nr:ferredoxin reductase [Azoarcus olearius]ANQ83340.1 flavodoxin reductase [Azoarcus olearius]CAL92867.1 hypothetical flavodoxin reductase [Azoarcus olearius]